MIVRSEFPGTIRKNFSGKVTVKSFPELFETIRCENDQIPGSDPDPVNPVNVRQRLGTIASLPGHLSNRIRNKIAGFDQRITELRGRQ